jgi:hypothetical protein
MFYIWLSSVESIDFQFINITNNFVELYAAVFPFFLGKVLYIFVNRRCAALIVKKDYFVHLLTHHPTTNILFQNLYIVKFRLFGIVDGKEQDEPVAADHVKNRIMKEIFNHEQRETG